MTMNAGAGTPVVGAPVCTMDGDTLGKVKEIRGRYFKVDAPMQPDYWLTTDTITSSSGQAVMLTFPKDRLGDFKMGEPDLTDATTGTITDYRASDVDTTPAGAAMPGTYTWAQAGPEHRRTWEQTTGASGRRWEEVEPSYRYGHEMAGHERYQGRAWNDAEADLRRDYQDWCAASGYGRDESGWDRTREGARAAWEKARG